VSEPLLTTAVEHHVAANPASPALSHQDRTLTYRALWSASSAVAAHLAELTTRRPGRTLLALSPGAVWVAALLGAWRAGAVPVLVDPSHPADRLRHLAGGADVVLVEDVAWARQWSPVEPSLVDTTSLSSRPVAEPPYSPTADLACVLHTSGSSGPPKPVLLPHTGLGHRIARLRELYRIDQSDRVAQLAAPSVDVVLWETLLALTSGAHLHIPSGRESVPSQAMAEWMRQEQITVASLTPTMLAALPEFLLPALRLLVVGGEPLEPKRLDYWIARHQVANAYGPTETTIETHVCLDVTGHDPAPIGSPVPGVEDALLDDQHCPVPDGQVGHLHLGGIGLAQGYEGMPDLTDQVFVHLDVDGRGVRRFYRTGDLAWRRTDGQLIFSGRADRQLNLGGVRVEPEEIERIAMRMPGVVAAAAVVEQTPVGQVLVLYAATPAMSLDSAQVRAHLAAGLPPAAVPSRIHVRPHLPLTASGKPDPHALKQRPARNHPAPYPGGYYTGLPETVRSWWRDLAGSTPDAADSDFFATGGTSLAALDLLHRINERYGTHITVTAFVAAPTPEHLRRALARTCEGELPA